MPSACFKSSLAFYSSVILNSTEIDEGLLKLKTTFYSSVILNSTEIKK